MQLRLTGVGCSEVVDAAEVAWVVPIEQADLYPRASGGLVGMARGMPVWVAEPVEGARWLVLMRPNGDVCPGRLTLEIDWMHP